MAVTLCRSGVVYVRSYVTLLATSASRFALAIWRGVR